MLLLHRIQTKPLQVQGFDVQFQQILAYEFDLMSLKSLSLLDFLIYQQALNNDARLWIWSGEEIRCVSDHVVRPFFGFEAPIWTRDDQNIIIKAFPEEGINEIDARSQEGSKAHNVSVFRTDEINNGKIQDTRSKWVDRYLADLVRVDTNTGNSFTLLKGLRPVGMVLSPDGSKLAVSSALGQEATETQQVLYDLWIIPVFPEASENAKCVASGVRMEYGLSYSWADDETLFYTTAGPLADGDLWMIKVKGGSMPVHLAHRDGLRLDRSYDAPLPIKGGDALIVAKRRLWRYQCETGELVNLATDLPRHVVAVLPVKKSDPLTDDDSIIIQTHEPNEMLDGLYSLHLATGQWEQLLEEPCKHFPWFMGGAAVGERLGKSFIAYFSESTCNPSNLYELDLESKETRPICELNPNLTWLGSNRLIKWNRGNEELRGVLLLPPERKDRVPVIVKVYGGNLQSRLYRKFGCGDSTDNMHLLTTQGFAVFLPDLPIKRDEPAEEIEQSLRDILNVLSLQPEIDSERMGIIGHSFGGYTTWIAITRMKHFRAAVVSAGIANLTSFVTHFDPTAQDLFFGAVEGGQFRMRQTLWENREKYIRNSPIFEFDRIDSPVLIVQGTKDELCFPEAGPAFSALRRLGKDAELALYEGEDHWPGTWKQRNKQDYCERVIGWFQKHL